jgi:hypothetical protein
MNSPEWHLIVQPASVGETTHNIAADPKPFEQEVGKSAIKIKSKKATSTTTNKGTTAKKAAPTRETNRTSLVASTRSSIPTIKTFPCDCNADNSFEAYRKDLRPVLERRDFNQYQTIM